MPILDEHIVPDGVSNLRLVDYLPGKFQLLPSKSSVKKAIKRSQIYIDETLAVGSRWVTPGQCIQLKEVLSKPKIFELPLEIVYEDEHMAIIIKPAGIPVSGNEFKTVQHALLFNLAPSAENDALQIPRPVHRLDVPTSGMLIIAKTSRSVIKLGRQLESKQIIKRYRAIVAGKTPVSGEIDLPINNQSAISEFVTINQVRSLKTDWLSLVDLFPQTGRTHQLRIHMANHGFPIVGDKMYVKEAPLLKGKGLFLAAVGLRFLHPITEELLDIATNQPDKFDALLSREERRWKKYE